MPNEEFGFGTKGDGGPLRVLSQRVSGPNLSLGPKVVVSL